MSRYGFRLRASTKWSRRSYRCRAGPSGPTSSRRIRTPDFSRSIVSRKKGSPSFVRGRSSSCPARALRRAPGSCLRPAKPHPFLESVAKETGLPVLATDRAARVEGFRMKRPTRVGLYRAANNMPAGWLMWLLEQYEFDHEVMSSMDFEADLAEKYDVILLPEGTTKQRMVNGLSSSRHSEEWRWAYGIGQDGWERLGQFVTNGGTLVRDRKRRRDRPRSARPAYRARSSGGTSPPPPWAGARRLAPFGLCTRSGSHVQGGFREPRRSSSKRSRAASSIRLLFSTAPGRCWSKNTTQTIPSPSACPSAGRFSSATIKPIASSQISRLRPRWCPNIQMKKTSSQADGFSAVSFSAIKQVSSPSTSGREASWRSGAKSIFERKHRRRSSCSSTRLCKDRRRS